MARVAVSRARRWASALTVACVCLHLSASPAEACTKLRSDPPVRLFPAHAEIPGNLIYFKVLAAEPGRLELVTSQGKRVAASKRRLGNDEVFAPVQPVAAGVDLVLHYQQQVMGKRSAQTFAFKTGPHAAIELRPAELQIVEQGTRYPGDARNESRFYRVRYYPPDVTTGVSHLLEARATVDGRVLEFEETPAQPPLVFIEAACTSEADDEWGVDSCGTLRRVPTGEHRLTIESHIVGSESRVAPVSLQLTFDCSRVAAQAMGASRAGGERPVTPSPPSRAAPRASVFSCATRHGWPEFGGTELVTAIALLAGFRGRRRLT